MKLYTDCPACAGRGYVKMDCPPHCSNEGKCDTVCRGCSDGDGKISAKELLLFRAISLEAAMELHPAYTLTNPTEDESFELGKLEGQILALRGLADESP